MSTVVGRLLDMELLQVSTVNMMMFVLLLSMELLATLLSMELPGKDNMKSARLTPRPPMIVLVGRPLGMELGGGLAG